MRRSVVTVLAVSVALVSVMGFSSATAQTWEAKQYTCGPNGDDRVLWMFVESSGSCSDTDPYCSSATSEAEADCDHGCQHIANQAGCYATTRELWDPRQLPVTPLGSIECETGPKAGKIYDMTPSEGGRCEATKDAAGNNNGGQCKSATGEVNATMDCDHGCQSWGNGADCKVRS